ncbi:hypothetical protein ETU08_02290 [Apibacter muscae]|nr:hypothetical protein ETU08_02290 [Apibacter muscae]
MGILFCERIVKFFVLYPIILILKVQIEFIENLVLNFIYKIKNKYFIFNSSKKVNHILILLYLYEIKLNYYQLFMMSRTYSSVPDGKGSIIACTIKIDGKEVLHQSGSYHLEMKQSMCEHSTFRLLCPADAFETSRDFPLTNSKNLFGKKIYISFKQFGETTFIFQGIITQLNWKIEDNNPQLELIGQSPTILLEQGELCKSYENQTLEQIVTQTCEGLPRDIFELKVKPKYKNKIPYNVQYQETNFQYLQRLAKRYGELLYWNGEQLVFGGYGGRKIPKQEGEDAQYLQLQMKAQPQKLNLYAYQSEYDILHQLDSDQLQKKG